MKTLVLANQKGGVGKSAVATLLAHYLRLQGRRVLAIDLDHQGNLSHAVRLSKRAAVAAFGADRLLTEAVGAVPATDFVLVPGDPKLLTLERQPERHNAFANNLHRFLPAIADRFDVCLIDTNPNPDIRVIAALASADFVLSPIQLNQEAMDGVGSLLNHERVGVRRIKAVLNPKLQLVGLLPVMVEPTPFQRANFAQLVEQYHPLLIRLGDGPGNFAAIPRRSAVAEAQARGDVLWEMKKTAARDTWKEIEPSLRKIVGIVVPLETSAVAQEAEHGAHA
jgi:chromosome partitioning protein